LNETPIKIMIDLKYIGQSHDQTSA